MPPTKATKAAVSKAEAARRRRQAAAAKPPTPAKAGRGSGWRRGAEMEPQELTLPSGSTCLVLQPGLESLIGSGAIEKVDVLTPLVDRELVQPARKGQKTPSLASQLSSDQILSMIELADRVTVAVCVDPPVQFAPMPQCLTCEWEGANLHEHRPADRHELKMKPRDPEVFYTDGVDIADKMEILSFAIGGTQAVAPFLEEFHAGMETVAAVEDVELPAE